MAHDIEIRLRVDEKEKNMVDVMSTLLVEKGLIDKPTVAETIRFSIRHLRNSMLKAIEVERYADQ